MPGSELVEVCDQLVQYAETSNLSGVMQWCVLTLAQLRDIRVRSLHATRVSDAAVETRTAAVGVQMAAHIGDVPLSARFAGSASVGVQSALKCLH